MIKKRNVKMYICEKSTIVAFSFFVSFLLLLLISFLPPIQSIKGISDNFVRYEIDYLDTNNYSVTYAVSGHHLFYSQYKSQNSTLNNYAGIEDYSNEYGTMDVKQYNFIQIEYDFGANIIDVQGIPDNMIGQDGETFILTESNTLYCLTSRFDTIQKVDQNVDQFFIKYDTSEQRYIYLIKDTQNKVYLAEYSANNIFNKTYLFDSSCSYLYYLNQDGINTKVLTQENNQLFLYESNGNITNKNALNIQSEKIINLYNNYYVLNNNQVSLLTYQNDSFITSSVSCNQSIKDIYTTGEGACIAVTSNNDLYYVGDLKYYQNETTSFESLNLSNCVLYGNRNSLIYLTDKGKLFLYDNETKKFEVMYKNYVFTAIIRYFSLFVVVMLIFYFIVSFKESNERYNRYFKSRDKMKEN